MSNNYKLVIRLSTDVYKQGNRYVYSKTITPQKRKSTLQWYDMVCDEEVELPNLLSDNSLEDGLYTIEATNIRTDWESGIADDWDLVLVPYKEDK